MADWLRIGLYLMFSSVLASLTLFFFSLFFLVFILDIDIFLVRNSIFGVNVGLLSKFTFSRLKVAQDSSSCLAILKLLILRNLFQTPTFHSQYIFSEQLYVKLTIFLMLPVSTLNRRVARKFSSGGSKSSKISATIVA